LGEREVRDSVKKGKSMEKKAQGMGGAGDLGVRNNKAE